jgi:hypothetical protein
MIDPEIRLERKAIVDTKPMMKDARATGLAK